MFNEYISGDYMNYEINGVVNIKKGGERKFTKTFEAKTQKHAEELLYAYFGSKNNVKRSQIKITEIKKVSK